MPAPAAAPPSPMMPTMMRMMQAGMMPPGGMGGMPFDHIEGHIAFLKAELGIADAQLPRWNAFADALRRGAKDMKTAMTSMMQGGHANNRSRADGGDGPNDVGAPRRHEDDACGGKIALRRPLG